MEFSSGREKESNLPHCIFLSFVPTHFWKIAYFPSLLIPMNTQKYDCLEKAATTTS